MIIALLAATVLLADVTPAATPTPAEAAKPAKKDADPNARVCHNEVMAGSRLPVRKCVSSAEAAVEKERAEHELTKLQSDHYNAPR